MSALTRRTVAVCATLGVALAGGLVAPAAALAAPAPAPSAAPFLAPYYTELDRTGDDQVTAADLAALAPHIGSATGDADWADAARFDLDDDGAVTASDLADLSERIIYDDGPFQIVEADAVAMQAAMNAGVITSVSLTQQYLDRIAAYDKVVRQDGGRPLTRSSPRVRWR